MQGENNKNKIITRLAKLVCLFIPFLFVFLIWRCCGIFFQTNDDRTIAEILSGVLAPEPEWHTTHVNVILSLPLSLLYRLTSEIPWYGGCLILLHGIMYFVLAKGMLNGYKCFFGYIVSFFMIICVFLLNINMLAQIQYTSTAALLACFGYAALFLWDGEKKAWGIFFSLEFMSCLLRDQSMLMIQPLGMAAYAGWEIAKKDSAWNRKMKKTATALGIVIGILLVSFAARTLAYLEPEWHEYLVGNSAREKIFDYGVKPGYEEVEDILKHYGVTESQYNAYINNTIMEGDLSVQCIEEVAEYCGANREKSFTLPEALVKSIKQYRTGEYQKMNRVALLLWIFFGVWCIVTRQFQQAIPGGFLLVGRTFVWTILLYRGRIPERVTLPLFFSEILLLLLLIRKSIPEKKSTLTVVTATVILLIFGGEVYSCGQTQYRYITALNQGQKIFFVGMKELQDYCAQHPERQYYVETMSLAYYTGSALETKIYQERDYLPTGGWYAASPAMNEKISEFRKNREKGVYLIIFKDGNQRNHPAVLYFEEKTASEPTEMDSFTLSHGGSYVVYYFEDKVDM